MLAFKHSVLNANILKRERNIEQVKYITEAFLLEALLVVHLINEFYRALESKYSSQYHQDSTIDLYPKVQESKPHSYMLFL
jgi:hypothetical protein